jgi:hypothetical protein
VAVEVAWGGLHERLNLSVEGFDDAGVGGAENVVSEPDQVSRGVEADLPYEEVAVRASV